MFGSEPYSAHDEKLASRGLYALDGYLRYWASYHQLVLETVPREKLFVVRTQDIGVRAKGISDFVDLDGVRQDHTHAYARKHKKLKLTDLVDASVMEDHVDALTSRARGILASHCLGL